MKLTAFLLTVAFLHVSARGVSQNITFSGRNVPLEKVFAELKKQTGFVFFYDMDVVDHSAPVTISVKNISLDSFLRIALHNRPLKYIIQNNSVVVFPDQAEKSPVSEDNTPITVTGRITDGDGNPLAAANVAVRNPSNMTVFATGADGRFRVTAEPGTVVEISYVGFKTFIFTVSKQDQTVNVILTQSTATMNQITVSTGYQTIAKERSTGAFTKVQGEEIVQKSVSMNVIDRLEGMVPGLAVNYGQGADKFLIRGVNSVNANRAPLYVLDGVPISYDDITRLVNPNDVENIVVLRDAMASSIWGSQAANGVVVITSKRGRSSMGKIKVQYNGFISFKGLPDYSYQQLMGPRQFISTAKEIFDPVAFPYSSVTGLGANFELPVVFPHEQILYDENNGLISAAVANQRLDSLASINNRSQIEANLMQPSMLSNNSVSFTGGNPFYSFYGSLSYSNQKNTDRSNMNLYSVNFRQNFAFTQHIKLDLTTTLSQQNSTQFIIPNLPDRNVYMPYALFSDASGPLSQSYLQLYDGYRKDAETASGINLDWIPLKESSYTSKNGNSTLTARLNAGLTINFLKKFTFEGRYQYGTGSNTNYAYYDQNSYYTRRELVNFTEPGPTYYLPTQGGDYLTGNGRSTSYDVRNQLTYNNNWTNHDLTLLVGTEIQDNTNSSATNTLRGYDYQTMTYTPYNEQQLRDGVFNPIIPNYYTISMLNSATYTGSETEIRYFSLYGNLAYSYKKRYNLNGSIRMDQSNLFGTDVSQQYKPIWSVGGSWLMSSEPFFKKGLVNSLKLRLTYGIGGNSPNPGSGGPYEIIIPSNISWYNNVGLGYQILRPANKKLTWESTATLNGGVDVSLLNNRLIFTLDVYNKQTSNLLGNAPFDPTNGWISGYANLGDMNNKGFEIAIQSVNIAAKNFSWNTQLNFGYNHNEVTRLGTLRPLDAFGKLSSTGFVEGYSAYSLFSLKWAGLDNTGAPQVYNSKGEKIKLSTDLTLDDVHYAGTTQPVVYGGMTNIFRYKSVELSFLIVYNFGDKMRSYVNSYYSGRLTNNIMASFADRWKQPGDETRTNIPAYIADAGVSASTRELSFYTNADINVESAAYMKLRDLTLSLNLPVNWLYKLSLEGVKIYGQVNNILLWAANDQRLDPEYYNPANGAGALLGTSGTGQLEGAPRVALPDRMKPFFTFGLNVSFK